MSFIVYDQHKAAVFFGCLHILLHGGKEQVRPHNRLQMTIHIDGHGAHNTDIAGESVRLHVRKNQLSLFRSLLIPGTGTGIIADGAAVFAVLCGSAVIRDQEYALRQSNKTGIGFRRDAEQGDHHI